MWRIEAITAIMLYYLVFYHVGRRLANEFATSYAGAKLIGIFSVIIYAGVLAIGVKIITEANISFWYVFIITSLLTSVTIYYHIKSIK